MKYSVCYKSNFDSAHRLINYSGKCRHLHGHTYLADIEIKSDRLDATGFVIDFNELKAILDEFDHCVLVWEHDTELQDALDNLNDFRMRLMPEQTTVENISAEIVKMIRQKLPEAHITVNVQETPKGSSAYSS